MKQRKNIFYGWILCIACTIMIMGSTGIFINCASQFLKPVSEALGLSRAQFSLYLSFVSIASMTMSPFIGKIYSKINPHIVTVCGGLLMICSWICLSFIKSIETFCLLGFLIGVGSSLAGMVVMNILMNNWFEEKKGTVIGIAATGSGIGSMIFNPLASRLIVLYGYQSAYRILGICALLCVLPIFLLYVYKPEQKGLKPFGYKKDNSVDQIDMNLNTWGITRSEAIRTPRFWGVCFIAFGISGGSMGIFTQMMPYFTDIGYEQTKAAFLVGIISMSMTAGKLTFGLLNDKLGTDKSFILMIMLSIVGVVMIAFANNVFCAYIGVILLGIFVAAPFVLSPLLTITCFGSKDFANIYGLITFFFFLGPVLTPPLSGMIYDRYGSYNLAFLLYSILTVTVLICGIIILKKVKFEKKNIIKNNIGGMISYE